MKSNWNKYMGIMHFLLFLYFKQLLEFLSFYDMLPNQEMLLGFIPLFKFRAINGKSFFFFFFYLYDCQSKL